MISKLLLITDGCRFCNIKETEQQQVYHSRWKSFSLGSTTQPNYLFVISRILAAKLCNQPNLSWIFSLRDNLDNPNISRTFFQPSVFFQIADWGSWSDLAVQYDHYHHYRRTDYGSMKSEDCKDTTQKKTKESYSEISCHMQAKLPE